MAARSIFTAVPAERITHHHQNTTQIRTSFARDHRELPCFIPTLSSLLFPPKRSHTIITPLLRKRDNPLSIFTAVPAENITHRHQTTTPTMNPVYLHCCSNRTYHTTIIIPLLQKKRPFICDHPQAAYLIHPFYLHRCSCRTYDTP